MIRIHARAAGLSAALAALLMTAPAGADALLPGAGWTAFCFGGAGSEATTGCVGPPGFPFAASPYFTIAGGTTTTIEVTDFALVGDIFRIVLNNGSETFFSSPPDLDAPTELDPDDAFLGGRFSRAAITLDPGFNEFRIFAEVSPFGVGVGFVRVVSSPTLEVPAPAAFGLFGLALAGLLATRRR
jgi:MYXO-CTERM domain-containing protein